MKYIIYLYILFPAILLSQIKSPEIIGGTIEPVVVQVDGLSKMTIQERINSWIDSSYRSPENVIKVNNENQIRIRAYDECFFKSIAIGKVCYNVYYFITIDIKEGKYRFSFEFDEITYDGTYNFNFTVYFKKDGTLRKGKAARFALETANKSVGILFDSLYYTVSGQKSENDDW
jgi:hypothetical protein